MKNLLLLAGGALLLVGVYQVYRKSTGKASAGTALAPTVILQNTEVIEARDPLSDAVRVFNANPAATFAPAKTTVIVPRQMLGEILNYNMANELVSQ